MKEEHNVLNADGTQIAVITRPDETDYISLTDIARHRSDEPNDVIRNWMRNRDTIEFLGLWEVLNNPGFKPVEFDGFKMEGQAPDHKGQLPPSHRRRAKAPGPHGPYPSVNQLCIRG